MLQDDDDDGGDDADAPPIHSAKAPDEPKQGFWGALARKAKSILDDSADPPSPRQPIADQVIPIPQRSLLFAQFQIQSYA